MIYQYTIFFLILNNRRYIIIHFKYFIQKFSDSNHFNYIINKQIGINISKYYKFTTKSIIIIFFNILLFYSKFIIENNFLPN